MTSSPILATPEIPTSLSGLTKPKNSFHIGKRAARTGRNPRTGEIIEIPATYGVRISAGSLLKKAVTE